MKRITSSEAFINKECKKFLLDYSPNDSVGAIKTLDSKGKMLEMGKIKISKGKLADIAKEFIYEFTMESDLKYVSMFDMIRDNDRVGIKLINTDDQILFIDLPFNYEDFENVSNYIKDIKKSSYKHLIEQYIYEENATQFYIIADDKASGIKLLGNKLYFFDDINCEDKDTMNHLLQMIDQSFNIENFCAIDYRKGQRIYDMGTLCKDFDKKNNQLLMDINNGKQLISIVGKKSVITFLECLKKKHKKLYNNKENVRQLKLEGF